MRKLIIVLTFLSIAFQAKADTQIRRPTSDYSITGSWGYFPGSPANYYSHVSETTRDDYAYIYNNGATGGAVFGFDAFSIPANAINITLKIYFTAALQTSGTATMGVVVRVNSTDYPIAASLINPTTSFVDYSYTITNNPDTSSSWTVNDINGSGSNPLQDFGVYSNDDSPIPACSWCYAEVNYDLPLTTPTSTYTYTNTPSPTPTSTSTYTNTTYPTLTNTPNFTATNTPTTITSSDGITTGSWGFYPPYPVSKWDKVGEYNRNDSTYIFNFSSPGRTYFNFNTVSVPSNAQNIKLTIYYTGAIKSSGTGTLGVGVEIGTTAYDISASKINPDLFFSLYSYTLVSNPATGSAWTINDINGIGTNPLKAFGIYSDNCDPIVVCSWIYAEITYDGVSKPLLKTIRLTINNSKHPILSTVKKSIITVINSIRRFIWE